MEKVLVQKARMGSTEYYIAKMTLAGLVDTVGLAIEQPECKDMTQNEKKQRELDISKVVNEICPYLIEDRDHFFGSIVVDVCAGYDGIEFSPISNYVKEDVPLIYGELIKDVGFLSLPGPEKLIALDGQHRLLAMKLCLRGNSAISAKMMGNRKMRQQMLNLQPHPELADEEISVIFVKGDDRLRIKKIFSKMNRYSRKTDRGQNIMTAEHDVFAAIARKLFDEGQVLHRIGEIELVNWKSNALSPRSKQLTTVSVLYTVVQILAGDRGWTAKTMPESDKEIDEVFQENVEFWKTLLEGMETYKKYLELTHKDKPVSSLRDGNLLMTTVTQMALAHVASFAKQKGINWPEVVMKLNQLDWSMDNPVWIDVLVTPAKKKNMITGKDSIKDAGMVISYMVMGKTMSNAEINKVKEIISNSTYNEKNELPPIVS